MADVRVESFLNIERSLVLVLERPFQADNRVIASNIVRRLEADDFERADQLALQLSFGAIASNLGAIDTLGRAAFLLGESFFAGGVPSGRVGSGDEPFPDEIERATQTLASGLELKGRDDLHERVRDQIESERRTQAGIQQIRKAADVGLADRINKAVFNGGKQVIEVRANLTTSRLASLGALSEAKSIGARSFQINEVLDTETCPVCLRMHGKVFAVEPAFNGLLDQLAIEDGNTLASAFPFPAKTRAGVQEMTDLDESGLTARGWNRPPFHPGCRGVLVPVGSVPRAQTVPFTPLLTGVSIAQQTRQAAAVAAARGEGS